MKESDILYYGWTGQYTGQVRTCIKGTKEIEWYGIIRVELLNTLDTHEMRTAPFNDQYKNYVWNGAPPLIKILY